MNKKVIISKVSAKTGCSKVLVSNILTELEKTLVQEMQKGEIINFSGFGKFFTKQKGERKYINFQTGESFLAPPHLAPVLKFSKNFIDKF